MKARVAIGGPHAEANPKECLTDGFDVVVTGDGENITADTFETDGVVDLGNELFIDEYPIPDRDLLDVRSYRYKIAGRDATTLMTAKGCPYACGFCAKIGNRVRYYSVDRVGQEITDLHDRWGYDALMFFDDTFIVGKERAMQICSTLRRLGMVWRCLVRGDLVVRHGQEFVNVMAKSGCVEVAIGVESASDKILKIIHKGESVSVIRTAIEMLRRAGIRVKGLFIVGLPGEDHDSLAKTRQFVEIVPMNDADFTVYQPYRGSPIWENRQRYDVIWSDSSLRHRHYKGRSGEYKSSVRTSALTEIDIVKARDDLQDLFNQTLANRSEV